MNKIQISKIKTALLELHALILASRHPELFALGRKSVHMDCGHGHKFNNLEMAQYFHENGVCLACEHISDEVMADKYAVIADMAEANDMSYEDYMEALQ